MIKWFLSLFKKVDIFPSKPFIAVAMADPRHPGFTIEEYQHTQRYYPKYHDFYISKDPVTGYMDTIEPYLFEHAIFAASETEADELIITFKDQMLKRQRH